jgi:hypothetical protein
MFVLTCGDVRATAQRAATYGRPETGSSAAALPAVCSFLTGHQCDPSVAQCDHVDFAIVLLLTSIQIEG